MVRSTLPTKCSNNSIDRMDKGKVFETIESICFQMGILMDNEDINLSDRLGDDLGLDSLDLVELAMNIEDELGVQVSLEDMEAWLVVGDVVDTFHRLLNEK